MATGLYIPHVSDLSLDEWCWALRERNVLVPNKGQRRYQYLEVMRGDYEPVEFFDDLGAAEDFDAPQFDINGGWIDPVSKRRHVVETVGKMLLLAEVMRDMPLPGKIQEDVETTEAQFNQGIREANHYMKLRENNSSVFGPHYTKIRGQK